MIEHPVLMAPMAGITELIWRNLCREQGAGLAIGAMLTSQMHLWNSAKSQERLVEPDETRPRVIQIVGHDPDLLAEAAQQLVSDGADIIDINMGCPAIKVCNRLAGSALLQDLPHLEKILHTVVQAVNVPVTLKTRTGITPDQRNGVTVAKIAEQAGIQLLTVHGRTRSEGFSGIAEFSTLAAIKKNVMIPVIANGDIRSPADAQRVLQESGADGLMIGRGALGNPWILRNIIDFLRTGQFSAPPSAERCMQVVRTHVLALYARHGSVMGLRHARKQVGWYLQQRPDLPLTRTEFMAARTPEAQTVLLEAAAGACEVL